MKRPLFNGFFMMLLILVVACGRPGDKGLHADEHPHIFPDYGGQTLPPNIAPLNFLVEEEGSRYRILIKGRGEGEIRWSQGSPKIQIPREAWARLLEHNRGDSIHIHLAVRSKGAWISYPALGFQVAREEVDPVLAYRVVHATYLKWHKMGIYQRQLSNFEESVIVENAETGDGCMNCHSFAGNDPETMMLHFRIQQGGTMIWREGELSKIDTRTAFTPSAGIYPAWHPDGTHLAFSVGKLSPHLTSRSSKAVDVADRESDLVIYDVDQGSISTSPVVSTQFRETMPVWAPDGRSLYYLRAPEAMPGDQESLLHERYSLMQVDYSTKLKTWGEPRLILDADSLGLSISMPAISPDGKWMLCAVSDFGYFTIFHRGSDLHILDLENRECRPLEINSEEAESFSAWSSNGHWIVFSSKRMDGVFSRPHLAYMDTDGRFSKAFVLPQEDPSMYKRLQANFNLPKLIQAKVELEPNELIQKFKEAPLKAEWK